MFVGDLVIRNGTVVSSSNTVKQDILVKDGRILALLESALLVK